jgi:hypothetical protein
MQTQKEVALQSAIDLLDPQGSKVWKLISLRFMSETTLPGFSETMPAQWIATFNIEVNDHSGLRSGPYLCVITVDDSTGLASYARRI